MSGPAKILVVDDTPQNVKLLADLLAVKGYVVVTAAAGPEALEVRSVIFSSITLPWLNLTIFRLGM